MKKYLKKISIRWDDLDPNRHVGATAYMNLMDHARMSYFHDHGFTQKDFEKHQLGPIVFNQHIYYFKEISGGSNVYVSIELLGSSEDYTYIQLSHSIYNEDGDRVAYGYLTISWMDLSKRKLMGAPVSSFAKLLDAMPRSEQYKILSKQDIQLPFIPGTNSIPIEELTY